MTMILPKISIIIPIYNVEQYITECLQSITRQTYKGDVECILVDDCGKDNSVVVAEQFIAEYKGKVHFCILHHEHNRGLSAARNTGVEAATGDYIYFLDSDDYISDDCLEILTNPLQERDYDMTLGDFKMFGNPRNIIFLPQETGALIGKEEIFKAFYYPRMVFIMACNKLIKRELFDKYDLSFLEGQLHEDELWTYKSMFALESLYVQQRVTYYYRIHNDTITSDYSKNLKKRLDSCYSTIDYVLAHPASVKKPLYDQCVVYYFGVYLRNVFDENFDYWHEYSSLRKRFDYHPFQLLLARQLNKLDVKRQLHFFLAPRLGYWYLKLKRLRNQRRN